MPVSLSSLFGDKDDLIVVHNMGRGCAYCTMWADGFNGVVAHLEDRAAFVVISPDEPEVQAEFAESRGWRFRMASAAGSDFTRDLGFEPEPGSYMPGFSVFHRQPDGTIVRTGRDFFGPGDDYCAPWRMFDLLNGGDETIVAVERLTESFLEMDRLGVPPNYIARLKQEQALVVRNLMRAAYIQRIAFLPSAYTLVEIMLALLITLLMFTRVATGVTDAILLGFISLIFVYILRLLRVLDSPFRASGAGLDDVSLYQIDAIHHSMVERLGDAERDDHQH